jgi:fructose-1-phosphate kinase PfkB-like protein
MIVTVTPNPAVDKTVVIPGFKAGAMNRASAERVEIGGKGINVARNLVRLGCRVMATGFVDAYDAHGIATTLAAQGVQSDFISLGAAGALSVSADGMWRSRAREAAARGTVGAGDAMVAALANALGQGMTAPEALRFATAFGSAAAASATRVPSAENVERLLSRVVIEPLSPAAILDSRENT